jgi:hypothetical protein
MTESIIHITDDFWEYYPDGFSRKIPLNGHHNGIICVWNKTLNKPAVNKFLKLIEKTDIYK